MMEQLRAELPQSTDLPICGAFIPSKGDLCAALFSDGLWLVIAILQFYFLHHQNERLVFSLLCDTYHVRMQDCESS